VQLLHCTRFQPVAIVFAEWVPSKPGSKNQPLSIVGAKPVLQQPFLRVIPVHLDPALANMPAIHRSVKIDPFPEVMWFAGLPNGSFLLQIGMVFKNFLTLYIQG
jgi:hypothetical protein